MTTLMQHAMALYPEGDDTDFARSRRHLQKQWVRAIHILRTKTKHGWVMDAEVAKLGEKSKDHGAGRKVVTIAPKVALQ